MTENRDTLDGMAGPLFNHGNGRKGRYVVKADGTVVPEVVAALPTPASIPTIVTPPPVMGRSLVGEYLMVDIRVAKRVTHGSKLHKICTRLSRVQGCGVVESTLIIDLLKATDDEGRFLMCPTNWPKPESEVRRGEEA